MCYLVTLNYPFGLHEVPASRAFALPVQLLPCSSRGLPAVTERQERAALSLGRHALVLDPPIETLPPSERPGGSAG